MKIRFKFLLPLLILCLGLVYCSKDNDETIPEVDEDEMETSILLDADYIDIATESEQTVKIKEGNGGYRVISVDNDIATASISGDVLNVKGISIGLTSIVVTDKTDQLKAIPVSVYKYDKILLEKESVEVEYKMGNTKTSLVRIIQGNGFYTVHSEDEAIISTSISKKDEIVLFSEGKQEGKTNVIIKDMCGKTFTLKVEVKSTTEPFDKEELDAILKDETLRFNFDGNKKENEKDTWGYNYTNAIEDGLNVYGWDYYGQYRSMHFYFAGDKSVGVKIGSKVVIYDFYNETETPFDKFEIIKNDGTKIWAVFSYLKENVLYFGYFVQEI